MTNSGIRNRHSVGALAIALGALRSAGLCAAVDAPDHCIVGDNAIGCRSERTLAQITNYRGNLDALRDTIDENIASGSCRLFAYGERVYVTAVEGSERNAVRRAGDNESYWMPASWSRPADECTANASAQSLEKKIGMASREPAEREPDAALAEQPQVTARETPRLASEPACVIKPVMTDAEIAACRATR
jgi:hypothetical protein